MDCMRLLTIANCRFFIICLYIFCHWRSSYQEGVGIPLTGLALPHEITIDLWQVTDRNQWSQYTIQSFYKAHKNPIGCHKKLSSSHDYCIDIQQ
jgi:hypothetical protein